MDSIIAATDLSEHSLEILPHASQVVNGLLTGAETLLLACVLDSHLRQSLSSKEIDKRLAKIAALRLPHTEVEIAILDGHGSVADQLYDFGAVRNAGLIAVASHGRGAVARAFVGSVTEDLLRKQRLPLLVAPRSCTPRAIGHEGMHLVLFHSNNPGAVAAVPLLKDLFYGLSSSNARLTIVHLVPDMTRATFGLGLGESRQDVRDDTHVRASESLERFVAANFPGAVVMTTVLQTDESVQNAALTYLRGHDADFAFVMPETHSRLDKVVVGSFTKHLLHHSPCPVVAVPMNDPK